MDPKTPMRRSNKKKHNHKEEKETERKTLENS